jgi:hypothetical protein
MKAIDHYRPYLLGNKFLFRTDHQAIKYLFITRNLSSRLLRWSLELQVYCFDIEYLKGGLNHSDVLSRLVGKRNVDNEDESQDLTRTWKFNEDLKAMQINIRDKIRMLPNENERQRIMEFYHRETGHGSEGTMKYCIMKKYWWPGVNKGINNFV